MFLAAFFYILFFILLATLAFYFWGAHDFLFGGEDFETSTEAISAIAEEICLAGKERGVLYDLGSCRGSFALKLQTLLPDLDIICIDHSLFRVLVSRVRALTKRKRPVLLHGDLFFLPMFDADVINVYLPREMLPEVQHKISTIGKNVMVTMYRISFTNTPPQKIIPLLKSGETVTVYTLN